MMRFIYLCMAFLVFSFVGVPFYKDISSEHESPTTLAQTDLNDEETSLSFTEIYALADDKSSPASDNPAFLNNITPAAGKDDATDRFSNGFRNKEDSALADAPQEVVTAIEETDL